MPGPVSGSLLPTSRSGCKLSATALEPCLLPHCHAPSHNGHKTQRDRETLIHIQTHTCREKHTHKTQRDRETLIYTRRHREKHTDTCTQAHTHMHINTQVCKRVHTYTHRSTYTYTHRSTFTHTHTHTHDYKTYDTTPQPNGFRLKDLQGPFW